MGVLAWLSEVEQGRHACRCEREKTLASAIKLANHKRKAILAERIQAVMEWRAGAAPHSSDSDRVPPSPVLAILSRCYCFMVRGCTPTIIILQVYHD